jgi:hypothetical protein
MAAPIGNQFWKLRQNDGREFAIETAEEIRDLYIAYVNELNSQPHLEKDWVGKDAMEVEREKKVPQEKDAFSLYCGLSGWRILESYKKRGDDFMQIITYIETSIQVNQKLGAIVGYFKENIIARMQGINDSQKVEGSIKLGIEKESYD